MEIHFICGGQKGAHNGTREGCFRDQLPPLDPLPCQLSCRSIQQPDPAAPPSPTAFFLGSGTHPAGTPQPREKGKREEGYRPGSDVEKQPQNWRMPPIQAPRVQRGAAWGGLLIIAVLLPCR